MLDHDEGENSINSENNMQHVPENSVPLENQSSTPLNNPLPINQIPPIQQSLNAIPVDQNLVNQAQMNLNYQQLNQPYYPPINVVPPVQAQFQPPIQSQFQPQLQPQLQPQFQPQPIHQVNQPLAQKDSTSASPWEIISLLSWILFMGTKWDNYMKTRGLTKEVYQPLLYNRSFIQLVTLIISFCGFFFYIKTLIYDKDPNFYQELLGDRSKYHFIPLLMYWIISLILDKDVLEALTFTNNTSDAFDPKAICTFYMIFSAICICSIIFVYIKTEIKSKWYINLAIKKGVYSIILVEAIHHLWESIFYLRLFSIENNSDIENLYRTGGIFMAILLVGCVYPFAIYYKNIIMLFITFLMYFGMIMSYYVKPINEKNLKGDGVAVINIILLISNFIIICLMITKFKEDLIEKV